MKRLALIAGLVIASPAVAQAPDPHAGHQMPAPAAKPAADPHAGHKMPAPPADPHAGHGAAAAAAAVGSAPPPPVPTDHAADRIYPSADMAAAREGLRREHGEIRWTKVMLEIAEYQPDGEGYAWEGRATFGGDIHRLLLKSEGEGASGDLEQAEVQALYSRAVTPYFNLQAGVRQDLESRPRRTYATLGVEGLAPYWFDVEGALYLSNKGDLAARLEASYDLRLTQQWILEPRVEANIEAGDVPALGRGSGLADLEIGLRLRYAITPEFAPYVGLDHTRLVGDTADIARRTGHRVRDTRVVVGLRAWF